MIQIDVYADVVCPWCYIGGKRLEEALAMRPDIAVQRHWRPFQLRPEMSAAGLPWPEFTRKKFGGEEQARLAFDQVTQLGAREGIRFDFGHVASAPNTVDAHRLILYAAGSDRQWMVAEALFEAYFAGGANLNDPGDLTAVAARVGLDTEKVRNFLAGDALETEVWQVQEEATRLGVGGVPFYITGGQYAVSGAQSVEIFLRALDKASEDVTVR